MSKSNHPTYDKRRETRVVAARSESWIPTAPFALAALDPAHWSQRKQQKNLWRLLEQLNRQRVLH